MKKQIAYNVLVIVILGIAITVLQFGCADQYPSAYAPTEAVVSDRGSFCLGGCPEGAVSTDTVITHHIYEFSNNSQTKFADWVAYRIAPETLGTGCKRIWKTDPDLPPNMTLHPSDYKGIRKSLQSDRGHQAPLASLCGSRFWQEADYLSNITPQKAELNEGKWEDLERAERKLIQHQFVDAVYSITGPLYERKMPKLPYAHLDHRVPSGYWKIVSVRKRGVIEAATFAMDQNSLGPKDFCSDRISLNQLEKRSHLIFFPEMTTEEKSKINQATGENDLYSELVC
jgi:endonuclease G